MPSAKSSRWSALTPWIRRAGWIGLVLALLLPLLVRVVDRVWGLEVLLIVPHAPGVVTLNRSLWVAGEPVAEIYGSPMSAPTRVLYRGRNPLLRPVEQPDLALLAVGQGSARPIQIKTLRWASRLGQVFSVVLALAMAVLHRVLAAKR